MTDAPALEFSFRLPYDRQPTVDARFLELAVLCEEIKETRETITAKLAERKLLNAAMHAELLATLIRRLHAEIITFREFVRPLESQDEDVPDINFYAQL